MPQQSRLVTVYIGWPDKTWELRDLQIPAGVPEENVENVATSEALQQIEIEGRTAAFVGLYHYERTETEVAEIGGEGAV